jgi:Raf kinase inhibitor-like YbhB/YbcL family protein
MKKITIFMPLILAGTAQAAEPMTVTLGGIENGKPIASRYAFCQPDGQGKSKDGGNVSPSVSWSGAPAGTKSYALVVVDRDVPTDFSVANQEGKTIPVTMPRQDFYHWAVVNIPASVSSIDEGKGKSAALKEWAAINDFASFMKDKPADTFKGYDGPCPPWNDALLHHYHFIVYALDTEKLELPAGFTGKQAAAAMQGHILASGEAVGTYTNNPAVTPDESAKGNVAD